MKVQHKSHLEMELARVIESIPDPRQGLPEPVFGFVLKVTPVINVDLLVQDGQGRTLLAWREDEFAVGWHIPGGIVRYRERLEARIEAVAKSELGTTVVPEDRPCDIIQFTKEPRGHFISLLFRCKLSGHVDPRFARLPGQPSSGMVDWIEGVPRDLYAYHRVYERWLKT